MALHDKVPLDQIRHHAKSRYELFLGLVSSIHELSEKRLLAYEVVDELPSVKIQELDFSGLKNLKSTTVSIAVPVDGGELKWVLFCQMGLEHGSTIEVDDLPVSVQATSVFLGGRSAPRAFDLLSPESYGPILDDLKKSLKIEEAAVPA